MTGPEDDVRRRVAHAIAMVEPIALGTSPVDWRVRWLEITLTVHQLEIVLGVKKQIS